LSKLVDKNLPDISLEMKNAKLSSSLPKPLVVSEEGQAFILDTTGQYQSLDDFTSGVLVGSTSAIVKESPESITTHTYTDVRDFILTKAIVSSWLSGHTPQVWLVIIGVVLLVWLIALVFYTSFLSVLMLVSALILRFVARFMSTSVSFTAAFKLSYYALVPTMLLSAILFVAPNQLLFLLNLAVFAFLSLSWLKNLPRK